MPIKMNVENMSNVLVNTIKLGLYKVRNNDLERKNGDE